MSVYRQVFFGLGSNIGDSVSHLHWALVQLAASDEVRDLVASPFYESEAHTLDNVEQPAYINAVAGAKTTLLPKDLLRWVNQLERERGRDRENEARWASRTLDIDILALGDLSVRTSDLQIPHRRIDQRKFVLLPWNDIAPDFVVPAPFNRAVKELLADCPDETEIRIFTPESSQI